jgi:hypothetical protein
MVNPLEPLLLQLARDFTDNKDLSDRLHKIWTVQRLGMSVLDYVCGNVSCAVCTDT